MFLALVFGLEQNSPHSSGRGITLDGKWFFKIWVTSTGAIAMLVFKSSNALNASSDNSNFIMPLSGRSFG